MSLQAQLEALVQALGSDIKGITDTLATALSRVDVSGIGGISSTRADDLNNVITTGFNSFTGPTLNRPPTSGVSGVVLTICGIPPSDPAVPSLTAMQMAFVYSGPSEVWVRLKQGNVWEVPAARRWTKITSPIPKQFISPEQTITVGGTLTLAHDFTAKPKLVAGALICKVAEAGYAVGDELNDALTCSYSDTGALVTNTASSDATNIFLRFQNASGSYRIPHKTTGVLTDITPGNWRFIVRAWA